MIQYRTEYTNLAAQYTVRQGDIVNKVCMIVSFPNTYLVYIRYMFYIFYTIVWQLREKQDIYDAQSETLNTSIINGRFRGQPGGEEDLARFMQEFLSVRRAYHTAAIHTELVQRS